MAKPHKATGVHTQHAATVKAKHKTIKIKHHHAKPFRKRHVSSLFIFLILSTVLITLMVVYRQKVIQSVGGAEDYLSDVFNPAVATKSNVNSTYGFSFAYDVRTFSASAIDTATGDLFVGQELGTNRPYQTVRLLTGAQDISKGAQRSLTFQYFDAVSAANLADQKLKDQERNVALNGVDLTKTSATVSKTSTVTFDGIQFTANEWQLASTDQKAISSKFKIEFRTYSGVVNGRVLVIKLTYGLATGGSRDIFDTVLKSMKFGNRTQAEITQSKQVAEKTRNNLSLLDSLMFTHLASAATTTSDNSEEISSRYSPAVVKIYNVYCMDVNIDGKAYLVNVCNGVTGSGFFLDGNGTIATNGHVASADPLDIVIEDAIQTALAGDDRYFNYIANLAGVTDADVGTGKTFEEIVDIVVNKMYAIDSSRIVAVNNVNNLLVGLNEKQPDLTELVKVTKNRKPFAEQDSVKAAKLIAKDYRVIDGITSYKASDVALIKIDGSNYPVTKLGSITSVSQGASILILGYPGEASDNGLVESTVSKPTLTAGKVSSIKNVSGSSKKLIETDATIGHGNSGGPVLDTSGDVVGIATYTVDGSGSGDGVFNYVRDIQDLKDLASKNSVSLNVASPTQAEWNKGIDYFYKAHYSKAVKSFNKVKTLYPQHPKADELIAAANERIKNGQDVKDFPYILVIAGGLSLVGVLISVALIVRHRKAHKVYAGQVAAGTMQPMQPGAQPQMVTYAMPQQQYAPQPQQMAPTPAVQTQTVQNGPVAPANSRPIQVQGPQNQQPPKVM